MIRKVHGSSDKKRGVAMKGAGKAKKAKLPKATKGINYAQSKKRAKAAIKKGKRLNKTIRSSLGIFAILLCVLSSVLDVVIRDKENK